MPQLPPPVWADLYYDGAWTDVTEDVRVRTAPVKVTRGLSSESSTGADPTSCTCDLDSRDDRYAPRNPMSPLYGKIGRNTPFRWGYTVGSPWVELSGAETGLTTPGSSTFAVGDLDLRVDVALDVWATQELAGRYLPTGDQRAWALAVDETGQLILYWTPIGILESRLAVFSTVPVGAYRGQRLAVRATLDVDNGAGGYEVRFYTGRTVDDTEWELLGDPVVGGATTSVFDGIADIELGRIASITGNSMTGRLHAFRLLDGIGGTVVASMDASDAEPGDSAFTSGGLVWTAVNGATLSNRHVRMAGEIPSWPPTRDLSGNDNIVSIAPTGITRRMDAGNKPQDSALRRFIQAAGALECWPLTDGVDSTAPKSMLGGRDMTVLDRSIDSPPSWTAGTLADWIEPVIATKPGTSGGLTGATPRVASTGATWSLDLFVSGGGVSGSWALNVFDTGAGTDADNQNILKFLFTAAEERLFLTRTSYSTDDTSAALYGNWYGINVYDDLPHYLRVTVETGIASPWWYLYVDGVYSASGPLDVIMRPVSKVEFGGSAGADGTDQAAGYITYWDEQAPTPAEMWTAYLGFQGETAGARIERLAAEAGYTASVSGQGASSQPMGIQDRAKLLALLNDANRTDFGYLLDARDRLEVIQRGGSTLWNQPPALVLDYSSGVIAAPFRPVDDDKLTENDILVKRAYGAVPARQVLEEGTLSVQDPPDGVGRYDNEYTYSLATDGQAAQVASMRLHLGTYNGVRYTRLTLNLANERVHAMIDEILRIDVGDLIRLTNLPPDHGPDAVDVLVHGYEEEAGPDAWKIVFNCRPAEPWTAGVVDGTGSHVDTDGTQLAAAIDADDTTVSLAVTDGREWTSDPQQFPVDLRVGGEVMRAVAAGQVINSNPLLLSDLSGWAGLSATLAYDTSIVHTELGATASMRLTPAGASSASALSSPHSPVGSITPGASYTMCGWVYSPGGWSDMRIVTDWYDAADNILSVSPSVAVAVPAAQWTWLTLTATAPASASRASVRARVGASPPVSSVSYWWAVRLIADATVSATSPQTMTVARSVNGITKPHAAGTDVRLAAPRYVAL